MSTMPMVAAPLAAGRARQETVLELAQAGSGLALVGFMWSHVVLVSSVLLGPPVMNRLAGFLEDTHLAYWGSPVIVALFFVHAVLASRKIPFRMAEREAFRERAGSLRHWDSITWAAQVATGMGILVLGAIHLWVMLTNFPILAAKSGARVHGVYVLLYLPLLLMVEIHASVGLYRALMKWGNVSRRGLHRIGLALTFAFLALGGATLATLWRLGEAGAGLPPGAG